MPLEVTDTGASFGTSSGVATSLVPLRPTSNARTVDSRLSLCVCSLNRSRSSASIIFGKSSGVAFSGMVAAMSKRVELIHSGPETC